MEAAAYVSKSASINVKTGVELFGTPRLHWDFETDSLDKVAALNAKLLDRDYQARLEKGRSLFLDCSMKDSNISMIG